MENEKWRMENAKCDVLSPHPLTPSPPPPLTSSQESALPLQLTTKIAVLAILCSAATLSAQGPEYVRSHYTKREYQIPMRDGAKLFTAVYSPKDTNQTYPILMIR